MAYLKPILETLYFLSGPAIAIFAYLGLKQIKIAKENTETSKKIASITAQRESFKLAVEQTSYYCNDLIPHFDKFREDTKNITFFKNAKVEIKNRNIRIKAGKADETLKKHIDQIVKIINSLDSFALFFTSGVAAEEIAYSSIGRPYCNFVNYFVPALFIGHEEHLDNHTIQLFHIWNNRLEKEKLDYEKRKIEDKIKETDSISIEPIGVGSAAH